jgi:hypothetical protein
MNINNTNELKRSAPKGNSPISKRMSGSENNINIIGKGSNNIENFARPMPVAPVSASISNFATAASHGLPASSNRVTPKGSNDVSRGNMNKGWITSNKKNINRQRARNGLNNGGPRGHRDDKGIIGSSTLFGNLNRAPRRFHYKVGEFLPKTTVNDLKGFVSKFIKGNIEVENIELRHNKYYRLFSVSVDDTYESTMLNSENWPEDIKVSRFFFLSIEPKKIAVSLTKVDNKDINSSSDKMEQEQSKEIVNIDNNIVNGEDS